MTVDSIDFMERQVNAGRPFYLQISHYKSQGGGGGNRRRNTKFPGKILATDDTLGGVLDAVERLGIKDSTYIIYTSDHGSPGTNGPLSDEKGNVWEGGIRVPFIVAGPGIKAGANSHVRVSGMDLFPTFADLAGVKETIPDVVEGGSLVSVFMDEGNAAVKRLREELVIDFPPTDKDGQGPALAILLGDYKLIRIYETGERKLFNLSSDISERTTSRRKCRRRWPNSKSGYLNT